MTYPGSRILAEPTRAECAAADEEWSQQRAARIGGECLTLAEDLVAEIDRYPEQWRADDMPQIRALYEAIAAALTLAREIKQ